MESRRGRLPQQQHDNVLNPEIREAFGTGSVSEARMSIRESLRNYQKAGQQEPVQENQKQSKKPQDFSSNFSNPQAEQSQPRQPEEGKTQNKISGKELYGLYEESPHHGAERGRRTETEKEVKKGRTIG